MECRGERTADLSLWPEELLRYGRHKYQQVDAEEEDAELMRLLNGLHAVQPAGLTDVHMDLSALETRARLAQGRAAGKSRLVPEILVNLPIQSYMEVLRAFRNRYIGVHCENIESWNELHVYMIQKHPTVKKLEKQVRGVEVESLMRQWYVATVVVIFRRGGAMQKSLGTSAVGSSSVWPSMPKIKNSTLLFLSLRVSPRSFWI